MASTRYSQQPLQIYQDPVESFDHAPMPSMQNPSTKKSSPLRPIKNAASRRNIVFNPPQAGPRKNTPLKPAHQTSSSPSRAPFNSKLNAVSMPPPGGPIYNTDSMEKKPLMSKFKPQKALFTTFPSTKSMDKENYDQSAYHQTCDSYGEGFDGSDFSLEGFYGQKPPQKRMLMDAAPIHDLRPFKKSKLEETIEGEELPEQLELPSPDSFPPIHDDGNKPPLSYAQLIGTSILRSPARRLTLAQIYKWISDNFSFYSATDAGWQNSIRHNLSLNKAFHKQERPKDDPGKGNYWAILPGMEHQFIKDKTVRKGTGSNEAVSLLSTSNMSMNEQDTLRPSYKQIVPAPQELPLPPQSSYTVPDTQLSTLPELSSDATIPASDAFAPEELDEVEELPPSSPLINSSPPAMMHSSPPVPRHSTRTHNTPPAVPLFPSSSRSRSHKRKFASMDDSGYFSSLDSSAMRPHQVGRLLTSEIDRPRMKRGRAEEEIARIRGSSYDSPPKGRLPNFAPPSSSPLRRNPKHDSQMLPPLTPAMKLKAPVRPPLSASPNTNLKAHRDRVRAMVGSPERGMSSLSEELLPWSPAFNLDDTTTYHLDLFSQECDIFNSSLLMVPSTGSPEKRSAKRPRIERSRSANILADITNSNSGNRTANATPNLKFSQTLMASAYNSPIKGLGIMESPSTLLGINSPSIMISPALDNRIFDLPQDEFIGSEFLSEEVADFSGVDLTQGFQKIGSGAQSSRNTPNGNNSRPAFGRSFTSRF